MPESPQRIGPRIRKLREEAGLSLSLLADQAEVSKSYLWKLENGEAKVRPSGETLYKIAGALGTSMSALLGHRVLVDDPRDVPTSLKKFAKQEKLRPRDVQMLAGVNFRGRRPETAEDWAFVWHAIRRSVPDRRGH